MKSNAPGQFLGYAIQLPRALLHLLRAGPGDYVSIEYLGDVATEHSDGTTRVEEDKSSISANPLADKSENLWKTFSNWINAVNSGDLTVNKTWFVLFANKSGPKGIVDLFHNARQEADVKTAIETAEKKLKNINKAHVIWPYYNHVVNENKSIFENIIMRFSLDISDNGPYNEIRMELIKQHVGEHQIDFLIQKITGWLQEEIINKISNKRNALVSWEDYSKQFKEFFERSRRRELIDFTLTVSDDDIVAQRKSYPRFVRQLEKIEETEYDIIEAVSDYLKADSNRQKWIEAEIIDEDAAIDFESKLQDFWKNKKKAIEIMSSGLDSCKKGQLLYAECKIRQQNIGDKEPPAKTVAGTYHSLSNSPTLGWHPDWEEFKEN